MVSMIYCVLLPPRQCLKSSGGPYLLPNDESRMSSMYIPLCVVDSREYRCSYGGRLGGYGNPNEVSKRNDMDNG
jgi:hypothetical protein